MQGTKTHGIHYVAKSELELVRFTESDWEGDKNDRNWTYIYVFMISGGTIICLINKQSCI